MRRATILSAAVMAALFWAQTANAQFDKKKKAKGPPPAPTADTQEQRALDRLDLSGKELTKAQDALDAVQAKARREGNAIRQAFLKQVKDAVTLDQYVHLKDDLDAGPNQGPGRPVTVNDLVERVMVYDKNKTGKVSKEDLPERMQHLIAQGDLNGDGYLDREELEKLALRPTRKGKGKGPNAAVRAFTLTEAERAVKKLELKDEPKTRAQKALDTFKEAATKANEERRANLLKQMKEALSEERFNQFKDNLPAVRAVSLEAGPVPSIERT